MVDVFGSTGYSGNPLAVVHDAEGLTTEQMQVLTRWINLSETAFLLAPTNPEADYRVRIFTLRGELPFAGHPTLGSCHAWMAGRGEAPESVVQECGIGLVRLRKKEMLAFNAPALVRSGPIEEDALEDALRILGIGRRDILASEWVDNGPGWMGILMKDRESVLALEPNIGRQRGTHQVDIGVVAPAGEASEVDFEVRAFFADGSGGLIEDPVTRSLNASLAQWLISSGRAPTSYVAAQGTVLGREGRIHVSSDDGGVWVAGSTVTHVSGTIEATSL